MDKSLERLANQQEKDAEIRSKIRGAMAYPFIIILVLIGVVTFMITTVLPQVENMYKGLPGTKLPFITQVLLSFSHFFISFWWVVILLILVGVYGGRVWAKTIGGREVIDRFKMTAWGIGPLFMQLYMARFARVSGTLIASGVPMLQTLETTRDAIGNVHIAKSIDKAIEQVKGGKNLSDVLAADKNFLTLVPGMIHIGEQSGALEAMLNKLADYYEKEVDNKIKAVSTIIEPVLMVAVGVVALIVVAAVLLPIYGLAGKNLVRPV
jgi:type II secretory pathway component PulF